MEIPEEFSGLSEEYHASRETAILVDRSYRARVRASGRDHVSFLQNMLTNDVKALATGEGLPAAHLSRLGKLISDLVVYRLDNSLLLEMEPGRRDPLTESLSRYVVSEDVTLTDVTTEDALLSIEGPRSAEIISKLLAETLPELARFHFVSSRGAGFDVRVSRSHHGPGLCFDLAVPAAVAADLWEKLLSVGRPSGLIPAGFCTMEVRRIEAGIPLFGVDMDESHLPLEAGLDAAISFNKGCYVGQEYVARLAHRGHLNRKLVGLEMPGEVVPESGDDIVGSDHTVGHITSAALSPALGHPVALGYVQRDFLAPGTEVTVRGDRQELAARVAELPFQ